MYRTDFWGTQNYDVVTGEARAPLPIYELLDWTGLEFPSDGVGRRLGGTVQPVLNITVASRFT